MGNYPMPNNTTIGLDGFMDYLKTSLDVINPILGGNVFGFILLIPLWFILFLPLSVRTNPLGAFVASSFVCFLVSSLMVALNFVSIIAMMLFLGLTAFGAIVFYMQTRG